MKFIKPHHDGYLMIVGNGRVMMFTESQLKTMSMAYDELRTVAKESRRSFSLTDESMERLLERISKGRKIYRESEQ